MSDKPSLLERLLGSAKNKADENKGALEEQIKQRLKGIVYDDELVNELAPVFMKLQGQDGFNQVFELLETKERQIETISGGDWFKQETKPEEKQDQQDQTTDDSANLVDSYLSEKYKGN
jgi:hypothetical protein